ncbi:MAG: hypothetical protein COA42_13415 [Alteromonadaceae bacterium]|nr:MAG: hypothetical protein COA42_13415 [Alteromonadaceae bacterium]
MNLSLLNRLPRKLKKLTQRSTASAIKSSIKNTYITALSFALAANALALAPLSVDGNRILSNGEPTSLAGNSLFFTNTGWGGDKFYNEDAIQWLKDDWRSSIIRVPVGADPGTNGFLDDPQTNLQVAMAAIDAAIANDMYVIVDWQTLHAHHLTGEAIEFFRIIATKYGEHDNLIYEIFGTPAAPASWAEDIKPYANNVIAAIRDIDPDNLIIVGTPNFGQDVDVASLDPIDDVNVAYSLQFSAGSHKAPLRQKALTALNNGVPLVVTEWLAVDASGDGEVDHESVNAWMDFLQEHEISHVNWAINDHPLNASALTVGANPTGGWTDSDLTESGRVTRSVIRNWITPLPENDSDGDGIENNADTCADTPEGARVNGSGCEGFLIEAEHVFDFYDTDTINNGNSGPEFALDIESTTDNGGGISARNVGWIESGEWMSYRFNGGPGFYELSLRVASEIGGGRLSASGDDFNFTSQSIPQTGGWQTWETVNVGTIYIPSYNSPLTLNIENGGFNLNWLQLRPLPGSDTDSDGIDDRMDNCPATPANTAVDSQGCELNAPYSLTVEAEDFDIAYDISARNKGQVYRDVHVDIENTADAGGGYNVGWTQTDEWLEYPIYLEAGTYDIQTRVASNTNGGAYDLSLNGEIFTGSSVANTGGWQSWITNNDGTLTVATKGLYTLRLTVLEGDFNINWIKFIGQSLNNPKNLRVQAEDYASYSDNSTGNTGGHYRNDDVDIETTSDSSDGFNVGWIDSGEWLEYEIAVAEGYYLADFRVAALTSGGQIQVQIDGVNLEDTIEINATGGWQNWEYSNSIRFGHLSEGRHTVRLNFPSGSFNLNWMEMSQVVE